jgi:hypothetical protein
MAEPRKTRARASETPDAPPLKPARKPRARRSTISPSDVAERAYFMWLGQPWASPEENWLRAEQELLAS